jgi:hypothetical protein
VARRHPLNFRFKTLIHEFNASYHSDKRRRPQRDHGPPVTLGHIRSHKVRHLLISCSEGLRCHHSAVTNADRWPDETVLWGLDRRAVCTRCGMIGADMRRPSG